MSQTDKTGAPTTVTAEPDQYTVAVDDKKVGKAESIDRGEKRVFIHTEVDKDYEGRGLATILIGQALKETRDAGLRIVPECPLVAAYIEKHPEYRDGGERYSTLSSVAMTSHDQAFFAVDGDVLVPSPLARGPWGSTISGTYIGGLLARAVELAGGDPGLQPARLTVDLLRPVALAHAVRVDTAVEREGRRIRLVDAAMRTTTSSSPAPARCSCAGANNRRMRPGLCPSRCRRRPASPPTCSETSPWRSGRTARFGADRAE